MGAHLPSRAPPKAGCFRSRCMSVCIPSTQAGCFRSGCLLVFVHSPCDRCFKSECTLTISRSTQSRVLQKQVHTYSLALHPKQGASEAGVCRSVNLRRKLGASEVGVCQSSFIRRVTGASKVSAHLPSRATPKAGCFRSRCICAMQNGPYGGAP